MKFRYWLILLLAFSACRKENRCDCLKSNRPEITITRTLAPFETVEVNSVFDITWKYDTVYRVSITGGEDLVENVSTNVVSHLLHPGQRMLSLENLNKCNWVRSQKKKIAIQLSSPSLESIYIEEPCNFSCLDTIVADELTINNFAGVSSMNLKVRCNTLHFAVHAGNGLFVLSGSAGVAYYYGMGNCHFQMKENITDYCYMEFRSTGQAHIRVEKEMGVTVKGRGNVYYSGNPYKMDIKTEGEGKVIKEN